MKALSAMLGEAATSVVGFVLFAVIFFGPWIVARLIPEQAYKTTEVLGLLAIGVSIVAALVALIPAARKGAGGTIFVCSLLVWLFLWVWSLLIVDAQWGLTALYVANFFVGIGAIFAAVLASLFSGHWSILGQLVVIAIIAMVMGTVGSSLASPKDSTEA